MLSYRHAFHAGNHADVLKHAVQALIIESLKKKEKPFIVLDTHAGGGLYDLRGDWSRRRRNTPTGSNACGMSGPSGLPWPLSGCHRGDEQRWPAALLPRLAGAVRRLIRDQDKLALMELHNNEVEDLRANMGYDPRVAVHHRDGFEGLVALLPPTPRRGLVLIDPPYELKEDYFAVVDTLKKRKSAGPPASTPSGIPSSGKRRTSPATCCAPSSGRTSATSWWPSWKWPARPPIGA
jgi:23S rRNA (adenine2030-N6)-methyltransferase